MRISADFCGAPALRVTRGIDHPSCGIARCGELIAVTVSRIDSDPVVSNSLVDPALEITVAHIEKIVALKRAARRYPVVHENTEDLSANVLVGRSIRHASPGFERGLH